MWKHYVAYNVHLKRAESSKNMYIFLEKGSFANISTFLGDTLSYDGEFLLPGWSSGPSCSWKIVEKQQEF